MPLSTLMGNGDTGAIAKTEEDAVLTKIISVMDEWARKNKVIMRPEAKSKILVRFCHEKGGNQKAIESALDAMRISQPQLFVKEKCKS